MSSIIENDVVFWISEFKYNSIKDYTFSDTTLATAAVSIIDYTILSSSYMSSVKLSMQFNDFQYMCIEWHQKIY